MEKLNTIVSMLEDERRDLLNRLGAVEKALAALEIAGPVAPEILPAMPVGIGEEATTVVTTRVKAKRVLSDAHKLALSTAKRKSRVAKEVAKGMAREMPDDMFVPAIGTRGAGQTPRLIKRPLKA